MNGLEQLRSVVAACEVWDPGEADAIDGVRPALVARPSSVGEVGEVMRLASRAGWKVAPRGRGSRLGLGAPPERLDLVLDLCALDRVLEHAAGDLVASVEAGVGLEGLQAELAGAGQMLALDPPGEGGTVGGLIATNAAGPRRLRYGTVRDLLLGVTVVLADGTVARAGGKVVKNVAGYDLAKLMTGSLGTLGVIVRATFRLHPRPPAQRLVEVIAPDPEAVESMTARLINSTLVPSALQLAWSRGDLPRIGVLFEGMEPGVVSQAATAVRLLGEETAPRISEGEAAAEAWRAQVAGGSAAGGIQVKATFRPAEVARTLRAVETAAEHGGGEWCLTAMLGNGIVHLWLDGGDPAAAAEVVHQLRSAVQPGHVIVLDAPLEIKRRIDVWGPIGDSLSLMRRVKERFDPDRLLNPGRFVGGI